MSINPLSLGISSNYSASITGECGQTAEASGVDSASVQDSVQLHAGDNSLNTPAPAQAQYSSAPAAAEQPHKESASDSAETAEKTDTAKGKSSSSKTTKKNGAAPSKRTRTKKPVDEQALKDKAAFNAANEGGNFDYGILSSYMGKGMGSCKSIKGTDGDDTILISTNKNGSLTITINDQESIDYPYDPKPRLIIDGKKGNDTIIVDSQVTAQMNITGGAGDDTIIGGSGNDIIVDNAGANTIYGGAGNDTIIAHGVNLPADGTGNTIHGGEGRDYIEGGNANDIIFGDAGDDVIYGLGGNDEIHGGEGSDYIDGGTGNDTVFGDEGDDNIIGGKGDDQLDGGAGDDLLIGASGSDTIIGGEGADKVISSGKEDNISADGADAPIQTVSSMEIPDNFSVGHPRNWDSPQDRDRINSDLETLAHIEPGQKMFTEIAATGHNVHIQRDKDNKGNSCSLIGSASTPPGASSTPGIGVNSVIYYENSKITVYEYMSKSDSIKENWNEFVPIISLYHELCHSYNAATGTMDRNMYTREGLADQTTFFATPGFEYQAMGIDVPGLQANDPMLTENGLRDVLGLQRRSYY